MVVKKVDPSEFVEKVVVYRRLSINDVFVDSVKYSQTFEFYAKIEVTNAIDRSQLDVITNIEVLRVVSWSDAIKNITDSDRLFIRGKYYRVLGIPSAFNRPNQMFGSVNCEQEISASD